MAKQKQAKLFFMWVNRSVFLLDITQYTANEALLRTRRIIGIESARIDYVKSEWLLRIELQKDYVAKPEKLNTLIGAFRHLFRATQDSDVAFGMASKSATKAPETITLEEWLRRRK